jgi:MinD-like ATPase involved in chromosome partitioning or flagellar assembly
MFYSYKGGAGRTVAAANVAAALAKLGKRVLIMDMDFEAPGLHTVFGVESTQKFKRRLGIQDYFRGNVKLRDVQDQIVINMADEKEVENFFRIPKNSCLYYLIATPKSSVVFTGEADHHRKMAELINYLHEILTLDYIILDSASGIRDAFTLSIQPCDKIFIFFRWSKQHIEGTIRTVNLIRAMKGMEDGIFHPFKLVPSAVPGVEELNKLGQLQSQLLQGVRIQNLNKLQERCGEDGELLNEIPEITALKWQESVIVFNQNDTPYEKLANKILLM